MKTDKVSYFVGQRVENTFSTRCRLLRKLLNFVFLRRKMYDGTSTEQKNEKRQKHRKFDTYGAFTISPSTLCIAASLYQRDIIQLNLFGVFQGLYRQSEPTKCHTLSVWMIDTVNSVPQLISLFTAILLSVKSIILFTNASPSPLPFSE